MDKNILKKIAKDWAKGILHATEMASFDEEILSVEEQQYIVDQVHEAANRIIKGPVEVDLMDIVKKHYDIE